MTVKNFDFIPRIQAAAGERFMRRAPDRTSTQEKLKKGGVAAAEDPQRVQKRIERLSKAVDTERQARSRLEAASAPGKPTLFDKIGRERILGKSDLLGIDFLENALAVARFVCRIQIRSGVSQLEGYGTGFMVSRRLLLTNNHVLETKDLARFSLAEFDYQLDRRGQMLPVVTFELQPDVFFRTDPDLDFSLVAVREVSAGGISISNYGWTRMIKNQGKALLGDSLNIIQHPKGEPKQIVLRANELIDLPGDFAHYKSDTEPGSSGSPVFSDQWELVALHHSGVPAKEGGNIIAVDGSVWTPAMGTDQIKWVANEGIRVSSLVGAIEDLQVTPEEGRLRDALLTEEPPHPLEVAARAVPIADQRTETPTRLQPPHPAGLPTWTLPLTVSVSLGSPTFGGTSRLSIGSGSASVMVPPTDGGISTDLDQEAISIDPDYGTRRGYDPKFLGAGDREVPLPKLSSLLLGKAARNRQAKPGEDSYLLPYHHFSVVMNRLRRLAFFTAVNIDGKKHVKLEREADRWLFDPRLDRSEQIGNDVYASNPLDRGHLVRRLDPAWGPSPETAKFANDDTFHFTNCSPQHEDFNQGKNLWAGLEDYILNHATNEDMKVAVFTGPIFGTSDPRYRGVRVPQEYWKVVAIAKKTGGLSATGYIVSQADLVSGLDEDFAYGAYKTFQVPVKEIERRSKLSFGKLASYDPFEAMGPEEAGLPRIRELGAQADIIL